MLRLINGMRAPDGLEDGAMSQHASRMLGQKRTLTAACEDRLRALQDALAKREFTATR